LMFFRGCDSGLRSPFLIRQESDTRWCDCRLSAPNSVDESVGSLFLRSLQGVQQRPDAPTTCRF
jgi:hypothetical protein